jgi:hypothetical protein
MVPGFFFWEESPWHQRTLPGITMGAMALIFALFPNFHGVDASASRLALAGPSTVGLGP